LPRELLLTTRQDSASLTLRIIGKGNKERRVPLPQPVLDALRRMWKTHHNPRWLFPNRAGTRGAFDMRVNISSLVGRDHDLRFSRSATMRL
jgi:integrase